MSDNNIPNPTPEERLDRLEEGRVGGSTSELQSGADPVATGALPEPAVDGVTPSSDAEAFGRGEGTGEAKEVEGLSQSRIVMGRFIRHRGALFGLALFLLVFLFSFTAMGVGPIRGWWKHQDSNHPFDVQNAGAPTMHLPKWLGGKGWTGLGDFPFGQDMIGHDNFSQVMQGVETSIMVMFVMVIVAGIIGILVGAIAGYYRGWVDNVLMRFTDLVITLPLIVIGAVVGKLLGTLPQKYNWPQSTVSAINHYMPLEIAISLGLVLWPSLARLTRSEFLRLREYEFVDSARVAGASDRRIIFKHILPNALGVVIVNLTLLMSVSVVLEAALSFLGFGINPPHMSLGNLISANQAAFNTRPWLFWWPGLFIVAIALSANFVGDGLRDAFDPRTKRIPNKRTLDRAARKHDEMLAAQSTGATALEVEK